ncbi:MAG: hydroxyphenylacetyl-CoA thioesterase PaaI [Rubrivivax sp.]|nr:hydroxyphenylacetyl-CoA thioesterase PaaI [Rubrivivax sp.]
MTPQQVAEATRDSMWKDDRASRSLGMTVLAVGPGRATLAMTVREDMLNGHDICHGGFVTLLADSAFAYACNAYNEVTVASGFDVNLFAAAHLGDLLTAVAVEVSRAGRTGVYDITVGNQRGEPVAVFRGRSYAIKGKPLVEGLPIGKPAKPAKPEHKKVQET